MQEGFMKLRNVILLLAKRLTSLVLLVFGIACLATNPAEAASEPNPDELYHQAWQIIKDNYVDSTFNGQAWAIRLQ